MFLDDDRILHPKPGGGGGGGGFVGKDKSLTEGTKTFSQGSAPKPTPKPIINSAPPKSTPPKKR